MEETAAMKTKVSDLEAGLHHCIVSLEVEPPSMMSDLFNIYEEEREKVKEMASKIERSDKEINDLRNMVVDLQTKVVELLGVHRKIYQL
ncbi:unnamed protein product [Arabis nemorensis]|uniref:Uncharacterized protein n=1 Tax=Arabis nemorensis TaxID=586526 RepID=A0A565CPD3_9BRAS|nr:unnamed protein product [Arabis nemorensis]